MMLAIEGITSREIAERMGISPRTVDNHRDHIIKKTRVANILELARLVEK
jgi:DNA-binding CsgD family transcriptional regulator